MARPINDAIIPEATCNSYPEINLLNQFEMKGVLIRNIGQ